MSYAAVRQLAKPTLRRPGLQRFGLTQAICHDLLAGAVLLDGPAGYGKSTLLDEIADQPGWDRVEKFSAMLPSIACLEAQTHDERSLVIVDDVHLLPSGDAVRLARIVQDLPSGMNLLLAGRGGGRLEPERLVLRQKLTCYRRDQLRFSRSEVEGLLALIDRFDPAHIRLLHEQSEGWPLALCTLITTSGSKPSGLNAAFIRYCDETLFAPLSRAHQDWLLTAALMDLASSEAVSAISDLEPPSSDILAALAIELTGMEEQIWRLHPLFRNYLRAKTRTRRPAEIVTLHRQASIWFDAKGDHYRAASHAIESGEQGFIVDMLDRGARHYIAVGRITDACHWLDYLEKMGDTLSPRIRLYRVTALILMRRFAEADAEHAELKALEATWQEAEPPHPLLPELIAQNRYHECMRDYFDAHRRVDLETATTLATRFAGLDTSVSGEATLLLGLVLFDSGRLEEAEATLAQALTKLRRSQSWLALVYAVATRAQILIWHGNNHAAIDALDSLLDELNEAGLAASPVAFWVSAVLASHLVMAGEGSRAEHLLATIDRTVLCQLGPAFETEIERLEIDIAIANRDFAALEALINASVPADLGVHESALSFQLSQAAGHLCRGHPAAAGRYCVAKPMSNRFNDHVDTDTRRNWPAQARDLQIDIALGRSDGVESRAKTLLQRANACGVIPWQIEALMALAVLDAGIDDWDSTAALMNEAATLALQSGLSGLLLSFPLPATGQLLNLLETEQRRLIEGQGHRHAQPQSENVLIPTATAEAILTTKELEVLSRIARGHSNQVIADTLMISLATTKWHVRNILAKLDARNRTDAIVKARTANLLR